MYDCIHENEIVKLRARNLLDKKFDKYKHMKNEIL